MINRANYLLVKDYLDYMGDVRQRDQDTINTNWVALRHLLEWANETSFSNAPKIRPVFPRYLAAKSLSQSTVRGTCSRAKRFFSWLKANDKYARKFSKLSTLWIETLEPAREVKGNIEYHEYTIDEIRTIATLPFRSLLEQRDQAAVAMLFVSGMRISAFVTLPIMAVNIADCSIRQWPELGVQTKCKKRATTYMLQISDLLDVVRGWDSVVRSELPPSALWFSPCLFGGSKLWNNPTRRAKYSFSMSLMRLCERAEISYRRPHVIRHGFAVYGLKSARGIAEMEAISKTLMHDSLETTLRVYAVLGENDVRDNIFNLGRTE